jgi:GTPase SAR1 family protein
MHKEQTNRKTFFFTYIDNLLVNRKDNDCFIRWKLMLTHTYKMTDKESMTSFTRAQSVPTEVVLEVAAENLRNSLHECEVQNPKFVADHAKSKLQEFTFVVCGAPRTGKSTLINAIINQDLAPTKSGPGAVTLETKCYSLKGISPEKTDEQMQESQPFQINIWDTKGITTWDKSIADIIDEKYPMCMILCASPGSFAKDEYIRPLISQCVNLNIFVALVCTNQWNDSDEKRIKVMQEFHDLFKVSCLMMIEMIEE